MTGSFAAALDDLRARAEKWPVPGLQVAAVAGGSVVHAGGLGVTSVEDGEPVDAGTPFQHGSCTKAFTGLLGALLHAEGTMDLDAPVRRYVPELRLPDAVIAERATTRDLLSHRSGFGRHDMTWICHPDWSVDELLRRLEHLDPAGDLRAAMSYSNLGYAVAGLAMGRAAGQSWADLVAERLFEPLGMRSSSVAPDPSPETAVPHLLRGGQPVTTARRRIGAVAPAGSLVTTAADAAKWLLLHTGAGDTKLVDAARVTHRLQVPMPSDLLPWKELRLFGYGLGWLVGVYRGRLIVWHAGGVDGVLTETVVLPEDGVGVALSANVHQSDLPLPGALTLVDALIGEGIETDWYDRVAPARGEEAGAATGMQEPSAGTAGEAGAEPPTRPLAGMAGTYAHPGYGDLVVGSEGDALQFGLGDVAFSATHRHFDTWDIRYDVLGLDGAATFVTGPEGQVSEVVVTLEPGVPAIRFGRQA